MLSIKGFIGGKSFPVDTIIDAQEFADLHGGLPRRDSKEPLILKMLPKLIGRNNDPTDPAELAPSSISTSAAYTVSASDGSSFTLRYYKAASPHPTVPGQMNYTPRNVSMTGTTFLFDPKDYDLFVFWATCPSSVNSKVPGKRTMVFVYDQAEENRKAQLLADLQSQLFGVLSSAPDDLVVAKSASMAIGTLRTNIPISSTPAVHRNGLLRLMVADPAGFYREWISESNLLRGALVLATARNLLVQSVENGIPVWRWKHDSTIALQYKNGDAPFDALYAWASLPENTVTVMSKLNSLMSLKSDSIGPTPAAAPVEPARSVLVVDAAIGCSALTYRRDSKDVVLMSDDETEVLLSDVSAKDWRKSVIALYESDDSVPEKIISFIEKNGGSI